VRAILSVFDKTGLVDFARGLDRLGTELYSTGGTQRDLAAAGLRVSSVSDLTAFPEILDGRVKTLHPAVHAGILARRDIQAHMRTLEEQSISPIDIVVGNLYPFVATVTRANVQLEDALENIDIGGPTMIRAAAKNFPHVVVVVDPADYDCVLEWLSDPDGLSLRDRRKLALKAFQHVAIYDSAVAEFLRDDDSGFPDRFTLSLRKHQDLRYGENPHQEAAAYLLESVRRPRPWGVSSARQLHGLEMSYINYLDADAAWEAAVDFPEPSAAIVKHATPCGIGRGDDVVEAYNLALEGDPVSAYGGIVAVNGTLSSGVAEAMKGVRFDIVMARDFEAAALSRLKKRQDVRLLRIENPEASDPGWTYRSFAGGMLVQQPDTDKATPEMKVVSNRPPTDHERAALLFGWRCVKHVKSNAIVLSSDKQMLGAGAGQTNRVNSVMLAVKAAGERARGSALASDAFFPFPDSVELAAEAGVTAIIQPGGSIRDKESIEAADKADIAMVFTGQRHFRH
jgi:phosphoribosylaminoimidazolecarboxamide formyltransferase / IMP cyclohydrolase